MHCRTCSRPILSHRLMGQTTTEDWDHRSILYRFMMPSIALPADLRMLLSEGSTRLPKFTVVARARHPRGRPPTVGRATSIKSVAILKEKGSSWCFACLIVPSNVLPVDLRMSSSEGSIYLPMITMAASAEDVCSTIENNIAFKNQNSNVACGAIS